MLYKSEHTFRLALKKLLESKGWMVQIVEVGAINTGVPDLYVCKNKHEHWIELKNSRATFEDHWSIDFRPGQQAWLRRNYTHGAKPMVIEAGHNQYAIHAFTQVITGNVLMSGYELTNGMERIAYLLEAY